MTASTFPRKIATAPASMDAGAVARAVALLADPAADFGVVGQGYRRAQAPGHDVDALIRLAADFGAQGMRSIYYVVNPLRPGSPDQTAAHILYRRWLLVDVDPLRARGHAKDPASEPERLAACSLAGEIAAYLGNLGWPEPVQIDSGGGLHLLYPCHLPTDDAVTAAVRGWLGRLAEHFTAGGKVGAECHDLPRLAKLPGTWAKRGQESTERPYRMASLLAAPARDRLVSLEQIQAAGQEWVGTVTDLPPTPGPVVVATAWLRLVCPSAQDLDAWDRAVAYCAACPPAVSGQGGHPQTMSVARGVVWGFGLGEQAGYDLLEAHYNPRCVPPWSERELRHKCADAVRTPDPGGRPRCYLLDASRKGASAEQLAGGELPAAAVAPTATAASAPPPTTYRADELLALELPEPRWVVPGLLSEGMTILAGKPKLGKSWLALGLGLTVAHGGRVLGQIQAVPGDVLYLSLEDRLRRLQDRTRKILGGLAHDAPRRLFVAVAWPRQGMGGIEAIEEWASRQQRPTLVIIDVFARFRRPPSPRGSGYDEDYRVVSELKERLDAIRLNSLVVHHCKKAAEEDAYDEISGTNGIGGAADGAVILSRARVEAADGQPIEGQLFVTGRDTEEQKLAVSFDPRTFCWTSQGTAEARLESVLGRKILDLLRAVGSGVHLSPAEIAANLNVETRAVSHIVYKLRTRGLVERIGGAYRIPLEEKEGADVSPF